MASPSLGTPTNAKERIVVDLVDKLRRRNTFTTTSSTHKTDAGRTDFDPEQNYILNRGTGCCPQSVLCLSLEFLKGLRIVVQ